MKSKKYLIARKIFQYGIVALIAGAVVRSFFITEPVDFEQYCPFGGIQSLFTYLNNGNLACSMTAVNLVLGIALIVGILLFGKLFCSYICPLGTISEFFGKLGSKYKVRFDITGKTDKALRALKYILLFLTLYFTLRASELFCKEYDPFYSSVSGFGHMVNYLYATLSISIFILGSIFFRLFWCKYLCPLGAISNIFRYFLLIIGIVALYFILNSFGVSLPLAVYLGLACVVGYVVEITKSPLQDIKMLKIARHEQYCSECGLCSRNCPQGIDVANESKVTHPDCNMCGDCVETCPRPGALTINNIQIRWLPLIVVSGLVILAMIVGHKIEVPSTEDYWGTNQETEKSFFLAGLDQMTCVSTAKDYTAQFREMEGVVGAATYMRSKTAKITYEPAMTTEQKIRASFFIPLRRYIREAPALYDTLVVYKLQLDNNVGVRAVNDMQEFLKEQQVFQLETQFKENVELLVFCDASLTEYDITNSIEGNRKNMYNIVSIVKSPVTITGLELNKRNFTSFKRLFNNASQLAPDQLQIVTFELEQYPRNKGEFQYLINYIGKKYPSIKGLNVYYDTKPIADFYIQKDAMDIDLLVHEINIPEYEVEYTNGQREKIENLYRFSLIEKQ
ncbi:MAG: 4Fe-4S binding protein [Bacteroidales bacterium]